MPTDAVITALRTAAKGLTYQSESDAPFEPFKWAKNDVGGFLSKAKVSELVNSKHEGQIEEQPVEDFFAPLIKSQKWHRDEERMAVDRYKALLSSFQANLTDLRVFKVGGVEKAVYVVGKANSGDWIGLKTTAVET